jgi:hypothetical protein
MTSPAKQVRPFTAREAAIFSLATSSLNAAVRMLERIDPSANITATAAMVKIVDARTQASQAALALSELYGAMASRLDWDRLK